MEGELAPINRGLANVKGVANYMVDDDHNQLSSGVVLHLTILSQVNNPKKALGPVRIAACSALTHAFIASHHYRPHKNISLVWHRLFQLIHEAPTVESLSPMADSLFASDRGYNEVETISFLNET